MLPFFTKRLREGKGPDAPGEFIGVWARVFDPKNTNAGPELNALVTAIGGPDRSEAQRLARLLNKAFSEFHNNASADCKHEEQAGVDCELCGAKLAV